MTDRGRQRERCGALQLHVEVQTLDEFASALQAKADWIMLENLVPEQLVSAVARANRVV